MWINGHKRLLLSYYFPTSFKSEYKSEFWLEQERELYTTGIAYRDEIEVKGSQFCKLKALSYTKLVPT